MRVFEAIRQARPSKLYVAADGPRQGRAGEPGRTAEVRRIVTAVDWPCELKTLFRETNLGCRYGPNTAIDWFFANEPEGIILEDDCLPESTFFKYCEWALEKFRDNPAVWQINGNNFAAPEHFFRGPIDFAALPQAWGWAGWADRWQHQICNPFFLEERTTPEKVRSWQVSRVAKQRKSGNIRILKKGLDTWDFQWHIVVLNHQGLVVSPKYNQISNIGDGENSTHTRKNSPKANLPTRPLDFKDACNPPLKVNTRLTTWYESKMGMSVRKMSIRSGLRNLKDGIRKHWLHLIRSLLYSQSVPIVVASSGRSGSTMLTISITQSLIEQRFKVAPLWVKRWLVPRSNVFISRLSASRLQSFPVIKTHDLRDNAGIQAKYIFVYGDPLESALSAHDMGKKIGVTWTDEHIYNLHGHGTPFEILDRDVLNYEGQLKSWGSAEDVFIVHFEDLWNKTAELSAFVGFPVQLPQKRDRTVKNNLQPYNKELFSRLKNLEGALRKR